MVPGTVCRDVVVEDDVAVSTRAMNPPAARIRRVSEVDDALVDALADLLIDCVDGGASVSFMLPISRERAVAFWRGVARDVAAGRRLLLVAEGDGGVCGS